MITMVHVIVKQLPEFAQWLFGLKDGMTHRRLARRLEKVQRGMKERTRDQEN
jgi:putative component of toxin-antitoxin plasmid stabilization module